MRKADEHLHILEGIGFRNRSVRFVASDPGALANFESLQEFLGDSGIKVQICASGWTAQQPRYESMPRFQSDAIRPDEIVCLGSRVQYDQTREHIRRIATRNATSVFFFDAWKNYLQHFDDETGGFEWPDWIIFPDTLGYEMFNKAMTGRGLSFTEKRPKLATLTHFSLEKQLHIILSRSRALSPEPVVLLDPISLEDRSKLGYSCTSVLECARRHAQETLDIGRILVKPHPRQSKQEIQDLVSVLNRRSELVFELTESTVVELISTHLHIWGSTTVALILAHWAKRSVLSFQLGRTPLGYEQTSIHHEGFLAS